MNHGSLARTQEHFAANLDSIADKEQQQIFQTLLHEGHSLNAAERIAIYRNNSIAARMNALRDIYPVCKIIVGEPCFNGLARRFVLTTPSQESDLNTYGGTFFAQLHLALTLPGFEGLDYLPDLARLEWLWHHLYYADDDPVFDHTAFARDTNLNAQSIRFHLSASLSLFQSSWPVSAIWRQNGENNIYQRSDDRLVLWRASLQPSIREIDQPLFDLLEAISQGLTLGELSTGGHDVERMGELVSERWLVGHEIREE